MTQYFKVVLIMVILNQLTSELRRIIPLVNSIYIYHISVTFTKVFKRTRENVLLEGEFYMTWDLQKIITFHQPKEETMHQSDLFLACHKRGFVYRICFTRL